MGKAFANNVKLAFKLILLQSFGCSNKELLDLRLSHTGRWTDTRAVGIQRYFSPPNEQLVFLRNDLVNHTATDFSFAFFDRKEDVPHGILSDWRQFRI